jgi:hypothetical protein
VTAFGELRRDLTAQRAVAASSAHELAVAREELRDLRRALAEAARTDQSTQAVDVSAAKEREAALAQKVDELRGRVDAGRELRNELLGRLAELADPDEQIQELDDSYPILLFPLRVETRFRGPDAAEPSRRRGGRDPSRLCVRFYPDDCQVDSFEELLTKVEVDNARAFWIEMWRAGGVPAQERGAWRALVGGSGSGRAAYTVRQYRPVNASAKPSKRRPQDVVLVIVPEIDVAPAERDAAFEYFIAVWKADGNVTREEAALARFHEEVGAARAGEIVEGFSPDPAGQDPPEPYRRAQVGVQCAVLDLPDAPPTKTSSWTQAPRAFALPDRFVVTLFRGDEEVRRVVGNPVASDLATGPDPSLDASQQVREEDGDLFLEEGMRWVADFPRAVEAGMGVEIELSDEEAENGFDRLLVVGLRLSSDEDEGRLELESLLRHHYASKHGFGLVPQGSPSNNTASGATAHSWVDDADASYDVVFGGKDVYAREDDLFRRSDGQWLADALGIDDDVLQDVPGAGGRDQLEARAINVALWPATLGYALEEMLTPLVDPEDTAATRQFFTRYVSGRGPLPAIRVGKQPYGVLPALDFPRWKPSDPRTDPGETKIRASGTGYLGRLHSLLSQMDARWTAMSDDVAHVARPGNPHQTLLDVVGLHSGTVEYHQRYAQSFDQLYNQLVAQMGGWLGGLLASWLRNRSRDVLVRLGADPDAQAPILEKFFYGKSTLLTGAVVDELELSETRLLGASAADGKSYIEWLAASSLETIRRQDFGGNPAPTALLYLFLRHAVMLGHWDAGLRFLEARQLVDPTLARREPSFLHVQDRKDAPLSKFHHLYQPLPEVVGDPDMTLGEYISTPAVLATAAETSDLREIRDALSLLAKSPTARLERLFAEHVDCCSYRLDAWKTGLAAHRLEEMRARQTRRTGVYLGAFGWLEDVRPRQDPPQAADLDPENAEVFARPGDAPLIVDPSNGGYVHAPSLNHAAAAAILKNAHRVRSEDTSAMAVDLSSQRVRRALAVLEGLRNGQTLAALLGYRFERGLHDAHDLEEVDKFVYPLRQAFPLVANHLRNTKADDADIAQLEARNVLDGLKLVERAREPGNESYPFGLTVGEAPGQVPPATEIESEAIDAEVRALLDLHDAVADLLVAESVYQVVQGNFDRAAANTKVAGAGGYPPEIEIVRTPRDGVPLTHRVAVHLDAAADPGASPNGIPMTPRARSSAPLNAWLSERVPNPSDVVVRVSYGTPALPAPKTVTVTQADLGLQPLDLLYVLRSDLTQTMSELDDRIVQVVRYGSDAHPAMDVTVRYTERVPGKVTFFELAPLVANLRTLVLKGRELRPTDLRMPLEAGAEQPQWDETELATRVDAAAATLRTRRDAVAVLAAATSPLDVYARDVSAELLRVGLYGMSESGTGDIHAGVADVFERVVGKLQGFASRWSDKHAAYGALFATWPGLATDDERRAVVREAEGVISSSTTPEPPNDPVAYRAAVDTKKMQFDVVRVQLTSLLSWAGGGLTAFLAAAESLAPALAAHDAIPLDVEDEKSAASALRAAIARRVASLEEDLSRRTDEATTAVAAALALPTAAERVTALQNAARLVLGEDAVLLPRFRLTARAASELQACAAGSDALLTDLRSGGRRFPVDDWMYGLARVRDAIAAWEKAAVLSEGFGAPRQRLVPLQLPFEDGDRWLALEFGADAAPTQSRLLYTAHFAAPFDPSVAQCGILVDEWSEVVPARDVMTGLTFHFDRPGSHPPQTMILALPSALTGQWTWDDLMGSLTETFRAARARAVEPSQVDGSDYAQLLPATLMAVTLYQITIATNLAVNNAIYDRLGGN